MYRNAGFSIPTEGWDPKDHGWRLDGDCYEIDWFDGEQVPTAQEIYYDGVEFDPVPTTEDDSDDESEDEEDNIDEESDLSDED